jgi:hypothetical protein
MQASRPGKSPTSAALEIAAGQKTASVTIKVPDAASLVVETDCKAKGCMGAAVEVSLANSSFTQYLEANGTSTFAGLPVGDAVVRVHDDKDPGHPAYGEAKVTLAPGVAARVTVTTSALDASATISGVLVDAAGNRVTSGGGGQLVVDVRCGSFQHRVVAAADGSFTATNAVPGECVVTGLRVDPNDPMSGANGGRTTKKVVAPATGVQVKVNDFFHR